jgi:uncharacterized protein YqgV (UPF0045/DUF77 family)
MKEENQNSCFIFIVGASNKEQTPIYEHTCKWLLRVVNTKLAMTGFDIAKLVTAEDQVDVCIKIVMNKDLYIKHFGSSMNESDIKYELDATITEIKLRCFRALQMLHERIGERVKQPVQNDIRILVSWLDDKQ